MICHRNAAPEQRGQATQVRTEALQLLAPFLALPADMVQRVHAAVEAIVSDIFPVFSQVDVLSVLLCRCEGHDVFQFEHSSNAKCCLPTMSNEIL